MKEKKDNKPRLSERTRRRSDLERIHDNPACDMGGVLKMLRSIETDYGTQALAFEALVELLVAKGVLTEDEFADKVDEIDARDGEMDGTIGFGGYLDGSGI